VVKAPRDLIQQLLAAAAAAGGNVCDARIAAGTKWVCCRAEFPVTRTRKPTAIRISRHNKANTAEGEQFAEV